MMILFLLLLTFTTVTAQPAQQRKRPKVGLVLGGGGAKGAAQIGILKVIEEVGIPIDCIAGTSIGSILGGLYSIGYRADDLDSLFRSQEWLAMFAGEFTGGKDIIEMLKAKTDTITLASFDSLPIPFRCVAVNILKAEEVVLDSGMLAKAMRASMSVPGLLSPVKWDDMSLVDGGMINNLPVDVVKAMGADIVIAVDLTQNKHQPRNFSLKEKYGIGGVLDWLVSRPDWKRYDDNRKAADIYINPDLEGYGPSDFKPKAILDMLEIGRRTGGAYRNDLRLLKGQL